MNWMIKGLIPGRGKRSVSFSNSPEWLWGPAGLYSMDITGSLPEKGLVARA